MILHIINGDCALSGWKKADFQGEVLVWRENYLHGIIPETDDIVLFNRIRAAELHKFAPEKTEDDIFTELQTMHSKLFALNKSDRLILWLDCCPFDTALKKRLLELVDLMPEMPEVQIIQQDVIWDEAAFRKYRNYADASNDRYWDTE